MSTSQSLFRPEVAEARRQGWLGGISLAQPLRLWALAVFAGAAAVVVIAFVAIGSYTQRSRVTGQLVPDLGLATIVAPSAGVVERVYPEEGVSVGAGAPIALVAAPRATATGADAQRAIDGGIERRRESLQATEASQDALAAAQALGLNRQLAAARQGLARTQAQAASRKRQVALQQEALDRYRALAAQRFVSEIQLQQQEQALIDQVATGQELERQEASLTGQIAQIEQALAELPAQRAAQRADTARDIALLDRERIQNDAGSEMLVKAPVGGVLASRLAEAGQAVQAGQPLASVLPAGSRLRAQLFVSSRAIGFIRPGDKVLLRYAAYPYQKFGHQEGVVASISRNALGAAELATLLGGTQPSEPYYRVFVDIERQSVLAYGKREALRPGMLLEADILGERRKLWEWVLEPLYSLSGKI
jgi:membrane fusion protein